MSDLYVAASMWGYAVEQARIGKPCCINASTVIITQSEIDRLRKLVEVKDDALRKIWGAGVNAYEQLNGDQHVLNALKAANMTIEAALELQ